MQDNAFNYDKGVLAEILEPIMGKGLIPADLETWKPRRRAIVPAFHRAYLEAMVAMFGACTAETVRSLDALTEGGADVSGLFAAACCMLGPAWLQGPYASLVGVLRMHSNSAQSTATCWLRVVRLICSP